MFIEQIIEFELRGPGSPSITCTLITGYDKTKICKEKWITAKILQETMYITFPYLGQIT